MEQVMKVLTPKWWLTVTAVAHATVGTLASINWSDETAVVMTGFMFLTSITMLYAAFFTEGENQARLTTIVTGPVWVWFAICTALALTTVSGGVVYEFQSIQTAMPMTLWGLTALSGVLHGNWGELFSSDDSPSE